jgi:hypothetical protein
MQSWAKSFTLYITSNRSADKIQPPAVPLLLTYFTLFVCLPVVVSPLLLLGSGSVARQRLGKYVTASTNKQAAIEELLDSSLSTQSVSYQRKVCLCIYLHAASRSPPSKAYILSSRQGNPPDFYRIRSCIITHRRATCQNVVSSDPNSLRYIKLHCPLTCSYAFQFFYILLYSHAY